jgi:hypothetical protein
VMRLKVNDHATFYKICEKVEVHDEYVVICKDCSRICFNMEAWLSPHRLVPQSDNNRRGKIWVIDRQG